MQPDHSWQISNIRRKMDTQGGSIFNSLLLQTTKLFSVKIMICNEKQYYMCSREAHCHFFRILHNYSWFPKCYILLIHPDIVSITSSFFLPPFLCWAPLNLGHFRLVQVPTWSFFIISEWLQTSGQFHNTTRHCKSLQVPTGQKSTTILKRCWHRPSSLNFDPSVTVW